MRELTSHKVNGLNEALRVTVLDEPGPGNGCHDYLINWAVDDAHGDRLRVQFQKGPILESGVNGVSNEALLAIVEDRLAGFQSGPFACADNQEALDAVRAAMLALKRRTQARVERGVEGTLTP